MDPVIPCASPQSQTSPHQFSSRPFNHTRFEQELNIATQLGHEAFGEGSRYSWAQRKEIYRAWIDGHPATFHFICDSDGQEIGYLSVIPMRETAAGTSHYSGYTSQFELNQNHISPENAKTNLVYLQGIFLKPLYRRRDDTTRLLLDTLYQRFAAFVHEPERLIIYAEIYSPLGESFLTKVGFFDSGRRSRDDKMIMELHFSGFRGARAVAGSERHLQSTMLSVGRLLADNATPM